MMEEFKKEFIAQCIHRIDENTKRLMSTIDELEESEIWKRPNESSNSVGNIILHLCGNIRQYAISSLGRTKDVRERDKEFSTSGGYSKPQLIEKLTATLNEAKSVIRDVSSDELLRERRVQGHTHSGIGIVVHVTEHYSYHTGQIIFWTKTLKNKDLAFYAGVDLNSRNED